MSTLISPNSIALSSRWLQIWAGERQYQPRMFFTEIEDQYLQRTKEEGNMEYASKMIAGPSKGVVYSLQSQVRGPKNTYLTSLFFQLDEYCVLKAEMPAGVVVPLHSHSDRESFYILSGEMTFYNGDSWRILRQGDWVDVLSNTKHAWRNVAESSASLLVVTTVRMGIFLQRVSNSIETAPDSRAVSGRQEQFFKLVQEYGYWLGSPADNQAIGLSTDWHTTADQQPLSHSK